jgi:hypothetical protein
MLLLDPAQFRLGDRDGLLLADENHQPLAARDAGIEEISLQH